MQLDNKYCMYVCMYTLISGVCMYVNMYVCIVIKLYILCMLVHKISTFKEKVFVVPVSVAIFIAVAT